MIRGLYNAASGLITSEAKQNVIMNNIANANTTGYKSENLSIKSFDEVMISNKDKNVNGKNYRINIGTLSNGAEINEKNIDFTQGLVKDTESSLDFALEGKGFFTVQRTGVNNGGNYYTRDGHFEVNAAGYLVTSNGETVLGRNLATNVLEPINVGNGEVACDRLGNIRINGNMTYNFNIVDFENYDGLKKVGQNLYEGNNPQLSPRTMVKQNALEGSNVEVIEEMSDMMAVMRNFESDIKVLKTLDETLGKAVNEIGKVR
ncbi:flagellar hook-basal body complex protein [Clostridium faecium]|uniref:Flagellar basal body rod protein FlgG n=1 Tax=Clostridium faecium TaxID=2762223 RepID=A0ABR8YQC6_9CLOT|nr:flagellar hook-basal body complex protein [Clostridium faecium]MBD8046453.1 flagellar basal body rod protein FlgG [Clostridium faecium]